MMAWGWPWLLVHFEWWLRIENLLKRKKFFFNIFGCRTIKLKFFIKTWKFSQACINKPSEKSQMKHQSLENKFTIRMMNRKAAISIRTFSDNITRRNRAFVTPTPLTPITRLLTLLNKKRLEFCASCKTVFSVKLLFFRTKTSRDL